MAVLADVSAVMREIASIAIDLTLLGLTPLFPLLRGRRIATPHRGIFAALIHIALAAILVELAFVAP